MIALGWVSRLATSTSLVDVACDENTAASDGAGFRHPYGSRAPGNLFYRKPPTWVKVQKFTTSALVASARVRSSKNLNPPSSRKKISSLATLFLPSSPLTRLGDSSLRLVRSQANSHALGDLIVFLGCFRRVGELMVTGLC